MRIMTAANVEEAIEMAEDLKQQGKYNWFRGQIRADWLPISSAGRKLKGGLSIEEINDDLFRFLDWVRLVPELAYLEDESNEHSLFAIRQHYGYPTSYIDFTTEPSVAGFFASDSDQQPEEGTVSAIFCLDTDHLVDFYVKHKNFIREDIKIEPVSVDVGNLWRLQAQHGHFLYANHDWYNMYRMDRIEFPWTGPTAYPPRDQIYPLHKSQLEHLLDEFEALERRRRRQRKMLDMIDALTKSGVKIATTPYIGDSARYEKSVFSEAPLRLDSWKREVLSAWLAEHQEKFYQVVGNGIDISVRTGLGAPNAHLQIKSAFRGALSREKGLRARAVDWRIAGFTGQMDVDRYLRAVQFAWNGMRNLPYQDDDIAEAMGALTQLFLIRDGNERSGTETDGTFETWMPDAYEVEFGNDVVNTVSRAYCSADSLLQCLEPTWKQSCKDQEMVSSAYGALYACSKPDVMFKFDAFACLFARQIIPTQLARELPLVLYNPARINFFGNP